MDQSNSIDMAAPNAHILHVRLPASAMDDDFLPDFHQHSLAGFDTPLSGVAEQALACYANETSSPKTDGLLIRGGRFSNSPTDDQNTFSSHGRVDQPFLSPRSSTSLVHSASPIRDVERLVVKQTLESSPQHLRSNSPARLQQSFTFAREQLDDPRAIMERTLADDDKKNRISTLFSRAASNGDLSRIVDILDNFSDWVDINIHNEDDGSTPLIYAACFGQTAAVFMLLDAGAQVDARDKFGWTALVWATNNKHEDIVRLLLEHGASPSAQTAKGRTVADFLRHDPNDTTKIAKIFREPPKRAIFASETLSLRINAPLQDTQQLYKETVTKDELQHRAIAEDDSRVLDFSIRASENSLSDDQQQSEDEDEFDWENCLPDQMFVFSSKDIPHILDTIITSMEPVRSTSYNPIPAYVLFLAARFARNFSTPELLDELLEATITTIQTVTKSKPDDIALNAYWISNTSSFLHFLRKDTSLRETSESYQQRLEFLVVDMVQMIILEAESQIEQILETAILEHDTIVGLDEVKFQSDWAFSFWRSGSGRMNKNQNKRASAPPMPLSFYDVHPQIIHYVVAQLLHYVSSEIFNLMIESRKYLSRSKALQTRLNLSILEDWLRNNQLPARLKDQLTPLVQLLQLLQVLSQQKNLTTWIETRRKVDLLNSGQVKHVVNFYRYEINEERLPVEVTKYVLQVAADTEKVRKHAVERREAASSSLSISGSDISSTGRISSQSDVSDSGAGSSGSDDDMYETRSKTSRFSSLTDSDQGSTAPRERKRTLSTMAEEASLSSTTRDSKVWSQFSLPADLATRDGGVERLFVPQIPEEVMSVLDGNARFLHVTS
ncbi:hypothetical protein BGZ99_006533 [Dissophora globulifera]|uniref:Dilute domain-containing protein n=1 Tax=Dissophora globulifera TaxID=979702 RepID=A0A9P6RBZ1_9FUNG|nr:hypothetical protein BGZ99_006533 [Dissophora globulifera]